MHDFPEFCVIIIQCLPMSFLLRCLLTLTTSVGIFNLIHAQEVLYNWSDYLNYSNGLLVERLGNETYVGCDNGLFIYNIDDNSLSRLSKVNGLSDIGITYLAANAEKNLIIVGYESGNLDLIRDRTITNFTAIRNSSVIGDKSIRHIEFQGDMAYLSTGVGVIAFDVERVEVRDTYEILPTGALAINQTTVLNDSLFAATEEGLFKGSLQEDLTIFANWEQDLAFPDPFSNVDDVASYQGELYINLRSSSPPGVYQRQGSEWNIIVGNGDVLDMKESPGGLAINTGYYVDFRDGEGKNFLLLSDYGVQPNMRLSQTYIDEDETVWMADTYRGLVRYTPETGYTFIAPNGPARNTPFKLEIDDGRLWVAGGTPLHPGTWTNTFQTHGFFKYHQGKWLNFERDEYSFIVDEKLFDIPIAYPDPDNPDNAFVGTWFSGMVTVINDEFAELYDEANSSLGVREEFVIPEPGENWVGVAGIRKDDDDNVWMTNGFADAPLSVFKADGTWEAFDLDGSLGTNTLLTQLIMNRDGHLWMVRNRGGVVAYNFNETIDNPADDEVIVFGSGAGNGGLPVEEVYCIREDLDGEIWVGTADGVAVFYSPFDAFSGDPSDARQILVEQDGIFQFLLEAQSVSSIAVDGANRKWIGTFGSGVFLLSEDGTEEVRRFTKDNSPLFSDIINDIAVDEETGEVFIATEEGLLSFQGDAALGEFENECNTVYPNPVRETYTGPITIQGLMRNSDVRITDTRGNLVASLTSTGDRAIWDGRNTNGQRVATGVYFALISDESGESTCVSKILMVK